MRTHPRLRALFALLAVLGLTLAFVACGGDDSTTRHRRARYERHRLGPSAT